MKKFDFKSPVLEVGCGTGETLAVISKEFDIKGIDLSDEALAFCQEKGLQVKKTNLLDIEGKFNSIICIDVLEHIEDEHRFLDRMSEILNPGGKVFILVPSGKMMFDDNLFGHRRRYTQDSITSLIKNSGFIIESSELFGFPFLYYTRICLNLTVYRHRKPEVTDLQIRTLKSSFEHPYDNTIYSKVLGQIAKSSILSKLFLRFLLLQDFFANGDKGFAAIVVATKP
jgi:SAM-dependent methyltransferase